MKEKYKISFAPLQGYNDYVYRNLFCEYFGGVDFYYSSFLRLMSDGTIRNKDLRDISKGSNLILSAPKNSIIGNLLTEKKPEFIPQILGGKAEDVERLLLIVAQEGYSKVDINLGCPFPMVAGKGYGSGLLKCETGENSRFNELMEVVRRNESMEVSLKMRLGWSSVRESIRLLPMINSTPLGSVTVHARLGIQEYKGECDLKGFQEFYDGCGQKLQFNGDIRNVGDYKKITELFPRLYGIMIGRGLLMDPFLATDIRNMGIDAEERSGDNKFIESRHTILKEFHKKLLDAYSEKLQGEHQILSKMKGIWDYFLPETDKKALKKIKKSNKLSTYLAVVDSIFN